MSSRSRITWTDQEMDFLVNERKRRNIQYHNTYRGDKTQFWVNLSQRLNANFNRNFTGRQCEQKFRNLITDYGVSISK